MNENNILLTAVTSDMLFLSLIKNKMSFGCLLSLTSCSRSSSCHHMNTHMHLHSMTCSDHIILYGCVVDGMCAYGSRLSNNNDFPRLSNASMRSNPFPSFSCNFNKYNVLYLYFRYRFTGRLCLCSRENIMIRRWRYRGKEGQWTRF